MYGRRVVRVTRVKAMAVMAWLSLGLACGGLDLEEPPAIIHARFDPDDRAIPMPNDALRDAAGGRLDLPRDDVDLTPAERELFGFLNTLDGWSSAQPLTIEFTNRADPSSFDEATLEVWEWGATPRRVTGLEQRVSSDGLRLTIEPPRSGWSRGHTYVAMLRAGEDGPRGARGEIVEADAAFYFLRLVERLDDAQHQRAFPGDTRDERMQNAIDLEELRVELAPFFEFFEGRNIERHSISALWHFTITGHVELAMDDSSQRMPLPFDLLLDPHSGLVDLPAAEWDTEVEARAKRDLSGRYDGFALSAELMFEASGALDPATVNADHVRLYELGPSPRRLDATVRLLEDRFILVKPVELPLRERTQYAVVVHRGLLDAEGREVHPMPIGHFMRAHAPIFDAGTSQLASIEDEDAFRLEWVRSQIAPFLDHYGRTGVITAWPFRTQSVRAGLDRDLRTADRLALPPDPRLTARQSPLEALTEFALSVGTTSVWVDDVVSGTIRSAGFLDPVHRGFREDGSYEVEEIGFTMTIPKSAPSPLPVVIYAHGVMTERRFVLSIGDVLAREGFAAIAIDLPYHGHRAVCFDRGPASLPDPRSGEMVTVPQCPIGSQCGDRGTCIDHRGRETDFNRWPVLNYPIASGSAFIEIDDVSNTKDHFRQAIVDLGALMWSLRQGDWESVIGREIDTERFYFVGMSLGGIIGGTFVAITPEIERAVLNVAGADLVDLFDTSGWFGQHVDAFFDREEIDRGSHEGARFLNVARWFIDAVDPQSVAHAYWQDDRQAMIQMALLDFIVPNEHTRTLESISGLPRRDYVGEHAFLAIPVEPAYLRGTRDMAHYLSGKLTSP